MRDLCDSMERENDLKDQLKFTEEEAKMMRRRVADIDEENETLRLQLQRMSEKASKHKKKEKATQRELEEEKRHADAIKAALLNAQEDGSGMLPSDVILVVGSEGSDIISGDEPIPVSQRKDSTDEDLMNVMQMRVQLEMLEQELLTSHKKLDDIDLENENLQAEVKFLQERLSEQEANSVVSIPEPSTPNAYYEDKLKELTQDADELRWKLIEKDREIERLSVVQTRHLREHSHKKDDKLKKSKSLDAEADLVMSDLRRQLEHLQMEVIRLKRKLEESEERVAELESENEELKNRTPIVSVRADDAPLENIELKEKVRRLEEDNRVQSETIKSLTESLHKLSRDTRTYTTIATSPTVPGTLNIPGIPFVGPGTHTARAVADSANPHEDTKTRDLRSQLHVLQNENLELRRLMAEGGDAGRVAAPVVTTSSEPGDCAGKSLPVNCRSQESPEPGDVGSTGAACDSAQVSGEGKSSALIRPKELRPQQQQQQLASVSRSQSHRGMEKGKESGKADDAGGGQEEECDEEEEEEQSSDEPEEEEEEGAKEAASFRSRLDSDEEPRPRSILLDYPELKSKVTTSGDESRVELMEKVLDMDEEISVLLNVIRENEALNDRLRSKVKYLKIQLRDVREESRRTELDLLQELDMLHDKNSVMSNLLDIINERAEAAEEELERRVQEDTTHSPARSASNVSQVSALSDTSMGSDEVFLNAHANKEGVITRDWEGKLKVRIESLERLLAEERQKVSMAEKKLMLAGIDTTAPSVSDDVKLRMREKELLQEELLKSQRHLHIATDQIQGLKERIDILEEEHQRLKVDYGKLYDEIDKPLDDRETQTADTDNSPSSPESPFVAKRISVVEAPTFNELQRLAQETGQANEQLASVEAELARYKEKAKELEYKVEEINDIWRSKSAASDKEKDQLAKQIQQKTKESILLEENITNLKLELCAKVKIIAENEVALRENAQIISRLAESFKDEEGETKRHEQERQTLVNQLSQRDGIIRNLNETIRSRDERLKEKDEILFTLNKSIEEHKREMKSLGEKLHRAFTQLGEKDAVISVLRGQISSSSVLSRDAPATCQTDAEKESFRLKEALNNLQVELDRAVGDKRIMEGTLEKSRKALDEAMLMWDRERHALQKEANILEEKVRMYEVYNTMDKDETIETLKAEAQAYFNEKEALVCELSTLKLKHESSERIYKEQTAKLQAELTDKLRLLKMEVDSSSHVATEMERLRRQAEMAYRLQQEQRIIKAEHLAMKVRYETRIDRMSKEQNKMLLTIEKIHKERELDKQIIQAIQKNLSSVKDKYTEELLRSEEDKASLQRQLKEIEESRGHLEELQKHIRDLREKTSDQDRLRAELINKFATDRASWEIERANLNSQLNQLEEQLSCTSRQQERSKDIQVNMGMAWEKERREQRRILAEAHTLALDLQEQLRSREETSAHERKELIRQMESERLNFAKMQRDTEKKMMELESSVRMASTFHKRIKDMQDKLDRDNEFWQKEKTDLLRLLAESRHVQASDVKVVEDVLSSLIRLRELGMMLQVQSRGEAWEEEPPDKTQGIDQNIMDFVREAVIQICRAADDLTTITNPTTDEGAIKRISSSEVELLKHELYDLRHEGDDVFVIADVSTSSTTRTTQIEESSREVSRLARGGELGGHSTPTITGNTVQNTNAQRQPAPPTTTISSRSTPAANVQPVHAPQVPSPVVLRQFDSSSRRHDRPPSYSSGTRSAQTSRATTPETHESTPASSGTLPLRKTGFPEPPHSCIIPQNKLPSAGLQKTLTSALSSGHSSGKPKRPVTFMKSLSVDSAPLSPPPHTPKDQTSISASNTPTQPVTCAAMVASFSTPTVIFPHSDNLLSISHNTAPRSSSFSSPGRERVSPRTARRKFFEELPTSSSPVIQYPLGYQSWPERRNPAPVHMRQQSLPNAEEVRREAEEEHSLVTSKKLEPGWAMRTSASWDEKMHSQVVGQQQTSPFSGRAAEADGGPATSNTARPTTATTTTPTVSDNKTLKHTAKEKRRFFKKSCSLDSTVGSTIASVGVSVMPPGAPTGFTPSDLFAAVKGKLKPVFKRKLAEAGPKNSSEPRSPSPLFIQTEVPDVHCTSHGGPTSLLVPVPRVDVSELEESYDQEESQEILTELPSERSRDVHRSPHGKWRSKSADRIQTSVHADVIRPVSGVWKFNETAV